MSKNESAKAPHAPRSAPKHRQAKHRAVKPPREGAGVVRRGVVLSSVAVAATGVAVTGVTVLGHGSAAVGSTTTGEQAGAPLGSTTAKTTTTGPIAELAARTVADATGDRSVPTTSRSFVRAPSADPVKRATLAAAASTTSPAITRTERLSDSDPHDIAMALLGNFGWSSDQYGCLDSLWTRESGWRVDAANPSGAYGIPQALPGSKMSSAGADWATNPVTQITWGLGYIQERYGSPCGAWGHSESFGWY